MKTSAALMRAAERWGVASVLWRTSKKAKKWKGAVAKTMLCWRCKKRIAFGRLGDHIVDHIKGRVP